MLFKDPGYLLPISTIYRESNLGSIWVYIFYAIQAQRRALSIQPKTPSPLFSVPLRVLHTPHLLAVDEQPLLERLEGLVAGLAGAAAEDELGLEAPLLGDVPVRLDLLVDDGVVVLQVGAEALGLERDPQGVLVHGARVLAPLGELVGVEREAVLEVVDGVGVFEEEDSAVAGAEALELVLGGGPVLGWHDGLESLGDHVPEALVLLLQ